MCSQTRDARREVCAGIPRSGSTMVFRALAGLPAGTRTPDPDLGWLVKTHSFRPAQFDTCHKAIFLFGDPVASVLSTRNHRYDAQHFANCGAGERDPATTDIFVQDALNYEKMFDAWTHRQAFDLICVRYETLHDTIEEIEAFFGRHLFIPPRQDRQTVPDPADPVVRQIKATYDSLIAKVARAADVAVFCGTSA